MNYNEMVERYSKEKDLVTELVKQLKVEVDFVISDHDMATLRNLDHKDYGEHAAFPVFAGK